MEASSTPAPDPGEAPRHVFGNGGATLGADEIDAINRSLIDLVVPLSTAWSELLGHEIVVEIGEIGPGPTARPADAEPDPTASILDGIADEHAYIALGAFGGELGTIALIIPTQLGLVVVDILLGGTGRPSGERSLSEIDLDLLSTMAPPTFAALRHVGAPLRISEPVEILREIEEAELSERLAGGATVSVRITIGEHTQPFILVLAPIATRHLSGGTTTTAATGSAADQSRALLESVLADVVVEAIVTFPSVQVPSRRIIGLDIGDVIGLGVEPDEPLPLHVDGHHLADVRPARSGNDVACQIVSTAVGDPSRPHPFSLSHGGSL